MGMATKCVVHSETPAGQDFGKALMKLRSKMSFVLPAPTHSPPRQSTQSP